MVCVQGSLADSVVLVSWIVDKQKNACCFVRYIFDVMFSAVYSWFWTEHSLIFIPVCNKLEMLFTPALLLCYVCPLLCKYT